MTETDKLGRLYFDQLLLRVIYPAQVADTMIPISLLKGKLLTFAEKGEILSFGLPERLTFAPDAMTKRIALESLTDLRVLNTLPKKPEPYPKTIEPGMLTPNVGAKNMVGWPFEKYERITARVVSVVEAKEFPASNPLNTSGESLFFDLVELRISAPARFTGKKISVLLPTKRNEGRNPWITVETGPLRSAGGEVVFMVGGDTLQDYFDRQTEFLSVTVLERVERGSISESQRR